MFGTKIIIYFSLAIIAKPFHHFWLPHGQSDKGARSFFFEALQEEKGALVYGQKIIDFMREKKVFAKPIQIGNFRREYFLKHQAFYKKEIQLPAGKNFLYAPTWDDSESNCSFWTALPDLASRLPVECNLLVKLHPNTIRKFEPEIEILIGRYAKKKNLIFLPSWPPIYPILNQCSAYIGDASSIGYDFLSVDLPMYFLNKNQTVPLHRCGTSIDPKTFDFPLEDRFSEERKELYRYTFDPSVNWDQVKGEIDALCRL